MWFLFYCVTWYQAFCVNCFYSITNECKICWFSHFVCYYYYFCYSRKWNVCCVCVGECVYAWSCPVQSVLYTIHTVNMVRYHLTLFLFSGCILMHCSCRVFRITGRKKVSGCYWAGIFVVVVNKKKNRSKNTKEYSSFWWLNVWQNFGFSSNAVFSVVVVFTANQFSPAVLKWLLT